VRGSIVGKVKMQKVAWVQKKWREKQKLLKTERKKIGGGLINSMQKTTLGVRKTLRKNIVAPHQTRTAHNK